MFGSSEFGIRSFSALVGTATIPVIYAAAKSLGSRRAGLIAAALAATSPLLIWYSQEARNYALLVFLAALSFLFFVRALDERGHRWLWGWALASALALATHYFAFFLIVPELAWLLLGAGAARGSTPALAARRDRGRRARPAAAARDPARPRRLDRRVRPRSTACWQVPEHFLVGLQVPWQALPPIVVAAVGCRRRCTRRCGPAGHAAGDRDPGERVRRRASRCC